MKEPTRHLGRTVALISLILVIALGAVGSLGYYKRHDIIRALERAGLPEAKLYQEIAQSSSAATPATLVATPDALPPIEEPSPSSVSLPASVNLAVPFTVQAPHAKWEEPYKEFCEEASVLMAASYIQKKDIPSPEFADRELLKIKTFEEERFGYYKDTTAAETASILTDYFDITAVKLLPNPTVNDLKSALASGQVIVLPAAGQKLGNPYFVPPGPPYHMLVIKGYTADGQFIVNDPGTRRGADYLYAESIILDALHDWRPDGNVEQGKKVVIIVG